MKRIIFSSLVVLALIPFSLGIFLSPSSLAQEWAIRGKLQGTLKVVDLFMPSTSVQMNYSDSLVGLDKDNNWVPGLAEDWRWLNDRTIEFKLRRGVTFHNGEKFNAEAVRVNWEEYRKMGNPMRFKGYMLPDETLLEAIDEYTVRFTLPEPYGIAFVKFWHFRQFAPLFFAEHMFDEMNWGFLPEPGPWGIGPFRLVEGGVHYAKPSDLVILEAYEGYWDRRYPKIKRAIFDNRLIGDRKEAMRLCKETEGSVDIVSFIRPLDTLKVAMSKFARVVKSRDVTYLRIIFNLRKKDSKWRDIRLRKALNYAVNRKELWKYAAKGNAYNLAGLIPPGAYGHNPDLNLYTYDTTKARALLAEAGYPDGFEVKIITLEAWKLETQIMKRMLERIGLKVKFYVLTTPEFFRKIYNPLLDKPAEEQEWDLHVFSLHDFYGHPGFSFLPWNYIEETNIRWIEYDPVYEDMWKDMIRTVDRESQEGKIRQMVRYLYENAYALFIYSPLTLYAANKEVDFVPFKCGWLNLKETSVTDNHWSIRTEKK